MTEVLAAVERLEEGMLLMSLGRGDPDARFFMVLFSASITNNIVSAGSSENRLILSSTYNK